MPKINQEEYAFKPSNKEEYDWLMEYLEENTDYKWNYDGVSLKPTKFKGDKDFIASDFIIIEKDEIWKTSYPKSGSTLVIVTDLIQGKFDMNLESEETEVKTLESIRDEIWEEMLRLEDKRIDQWADIKYQTLREVLQKLGHLDEPEVLSQEWIDEHHYIRMDPDNPFVYVKDLQNLLVPKESLGISQKLEKVQIPQFVADWIEKYIEYGYDLYPALKKMENNSRAWRKTYDWYRKNTHKFVNAYLTGKYEVEEEPRYEVRCKGELLLTYYTNIGEVVSMNRWDNHLSKKAGRDWKLRHQLTEQEIKDYDPRFWPFAEKVEELKE